jgi:hypothetical protein
MKIPLRLVCVIPVRNVLKKKAVAIKRLMGSISADVAWLAV